MTRVEIILIMIIILELAWIFNRIEPFVDKPMSLTGGPPDFDTAYPATDKTEMTPAEDDPRDLPWIASWSAADRRARRGHNCIPTYEEAGPSNTMIYTTTKSCEDGMAHTRAGDRIIIPDNITTVARRDTISHELIHIYQRRDPDKWFKFYRRAWSIVAYKDPPMLPKNLIEGRRSNPDTWENPWVCWQGRWWPIAIYRDPYNPRLRDADVVFWDAWKQQAFDGPPPDWLSFFGTPAQTEHPHELAACYIVAEDTQSEAGRRLMNWWQTQGAF